MNAIEGVWMPLRIEITQQWNALHTTEWTDRAWRVEWEKFPQERIRALVTKMAAINNLIIEFEGENEFHG
jgi:hypothetical protein